MLNKACFLVIQQFVLINKTPVFEGMPSQGILLFLFTIESIHGNVYTCKYK